MIDVYENEDSMAEYEKSVKALLAIANMGTGGSRAAAQVLLSAYNGNDFHVDVTDLGILDRNNFSHAMRVFWGRNIDPWMEPHKVIENGDEVFGKLWDDYRKLHVQNRWKTTCRDCEGAGQVWVDLDDEENCHQKECRRCDGRGLIAEVEWPGFETVQD